MSLTLEDIAQLAGVSRATVSRVVNNYPFVRPEVRERVQRIVREHNYSPFPAAKMVPQRTRNIGVFLSQAAISFWGDENTRALMRSIAQECERGGYFASRIEQEGVADQKALYRRALASQACDGFIGVVCSAFDPLLPELIQNAAPAVLVGQHPRFAELLSVPLNEFEAARAATACLLKHGQVGVISAPLNLIPAQNCLNGYKAALKEAKIAYDSNLVIEAHASGEDWHLMIKQILNMEVDGVLATTPDLAQAAHRVFQETHPQKRPEIATPKQPAWPDVSGSAVRLLLNAILNAKS